MKHGSHVKRTMVVAAALAFAAQARGMGSSSGQGTGGGTGGSQAVYERHHAPEAFSMNERGPYGVPTWYSVDPVPRERPAWELTMIVEQSRSVPRWYAVE